MKITKQDTSEDTFGDLKAGDVFEFISLEQCTCYGVEAGQPAMKLCGEIYHEDSFVYLDSGHVEVAAEELKVKHFKSTHLLLSTRNKEVIE